MQKYIKNDLVFKEFFKGGFKMVDGDLEFIDLFVIVRFFVGKVKIYFKISRLRNDV